MLEVNDLNTYFGKSHILYGVSLSVGKGEIVSLLGRNGAGKSTTLKSIMGIARQRTGSVALDGNDPDVETYPPDHPIGHFLRTGRPGACSRSSP